MKKFLKQSVVFLVISFIIFGTTACSDEMPTETANNNVLAIKSEKEQINEFCGELLSTQSNDVFKYSVYENGIQIDGLSTVSEAVPVNIPGQIDENNVIGIAPGAFCDNSVIKEIAIPKNVKYIGESAFRRCYSLETVSFYEGLEFVGERAFDSCASLKNVVFPGTVTYIGEYVFALSHVENISIPDIQYIPAGMYYGTRIKKFIVPEYVTRINTSAFAKCEDLTDVTIPGTVKYIGSTAFANNKNLKTVNIEEGCTELGYGVFEGDKALENIYFPKSLVRFHASLIPDANKTVVFYVKEGSKTEEFVKNKKYEYVTEK